MKGYINSILKSANESIVFTKNVLKFGSGNIIEDIIKSESVSLGRSDYARILYNEAKNAKLSELEKIMLRAAAAKQAEGGNCHESAALVFIHLIETTRNLKIQMCRQKMDENPQDSHVFVRIILDDHPPVIVDGWGSNKQAFVSSDCNKEEVVVIHEEITNGESELFKESERTIKDTTAFREKQQEILDFNGACNSIFKTNDDLSYLEEDKYIGVRMKRAYNDPGLK